MRLLAALVLATAAPHVIAGDSSFGGLHLGRSTLPQARAAFGAPQTQSKRPNACVATWPRAGLTVRFGTIGSDPTDPCVGGVAFTITVTSRSAWRTSAGLRVGDPVSRIAAAFPHAVLHTRAGPETGYWLVVRKACSLGGNAPYPALLARVAHHRVAAFVGSVSVCD